MQFIYNIVRILALLNDLDKATLQLIYFVLSLLATWFFILGVLFSIIVKCS